MAPLPRGYCPRCGVDVALRKNGATYEHKTWTPAVFGGPPPERVTCEGSGELARTRDQRWPR